MKGIVFSEFSEMVETVLSPEMLDRIIDEADLPSDGAYTAVGTYDHEELLSLVQRLSAATDTPVDALVKAFGRHLAGRFYALYPAFFDGVDGTLAFLETIETHVHAEVRKLYPDAELPTFDTRRDGDRLELLYQSRRPFADLAEGLIIGCSEHFGESIDIQRRDLGGEGVFRTEFLLRKQSG
jgi:hypothetical protein